MAGNLQVEVVNSLEGEQRTTKDQHHPWDNVCAHFTQAVRCCFYFEALYE